MSAQAENALCARSGLNASEAATAWASLHFGGDAESYDRLQGGIGDLIRDVVEPVLALDEREQFDVLERWREEDRAWDRLDALLSGCVGTDAPETDARWARAYALICEGVRCRRRPWRGARSRTRRAIEWLAIGDRRESVAHVRPELRARNGFDFARLGEMPRRERELFIRQLGVYQLAELSYRQPRRELVRLRRRLQREDRGWFDHCTFQSVHLDDEARARMHRLFGAIGAQASASQTYLMQLGFYSVAVATQTRFRHAMRFVLEALPAEFAQELHKFNRRAATMPVVVTAQLRVTLDLFAEQWRDYHAELRAPKATPDNGEKRDESEG